MLLVGLAQRELGQFFAKVARWANRLHKSDAKVNLFKKDCEFDMAQKFFEFFNEDRQEAKLDAMTFLGDVKELMKASAEAAAVAEAAEAEEEADDDGAGRKVKR